MHTKLVKSYHKSYLKINDFLVQMYPASKKICSSLKSVILLPGVLVTMFDYPHLVVKHFLT